MPTANTGILGLQEAGGSGKITAFRGEQLAGNGIMSYLSASLMVVSGAQASTKLYTAATSGLFAIAYFFEVISASVAGATLTPLIDYYSPMQGAGTQIRASGAQLSAAFQNVNSSGIMWINSAASDIFLSTILGGTVGVPPVYNLGFSIFRVS